MLRWEFHSLKLKLDHNNNNFFKRNLYIKQVVYLKADQNIVFTMVCSYTCLTIFVQSLRNKFIKFYICFSESTSQFYSLSHFSKLFEFLL